MPSSKALGYNRFQKNLEFRFKVGVVNKVMLPQVIFHSFATPRTAILGHGYPIFLLVTFPEHLESISPTHYEQLLHQYFCAKEVQTFNLSTKKLRAKISYEKATHKMFVKLTPIFHSETKKTLCISIMLLLCTDKPEFTTTSEHRPPVYNDQNF